MSGRPVRVAVVGLGTVGRWLLGAIQSRGPELERRFGLDLRVVSAATRSGGFVHDPDGLALDRLLAARRGEDRLLADDVERWPTAAAGLAATEADVLVEVSQSPSGDGEPGLSHIRAALERGMPVATSNKWPVALAGVELAELARRNDTELRAESTVMSGTPVLTALTEGLGGARPVRLRGVLNATVNEICTRMATGSGYEDALAGAQEAGLAEPDPAEDVEGHDSVAKLMILSALVFGRQLEPADVRRAGVADLDRSRAEEAFGAGKRIREVAELDLRRDGDEGAWASVAVVPVAADDPLFELAGAANRIDLEADPLGWISVAGPGAGPKLAGQGVFSDLIALARRR